MGIADTSHSRITAIFDSNIELPLVRELALGVIAIAFIIYFTRGIEPKQQTKTTDDVKRPPAHPAWMPFLGHFPQMVLGVDGFLSRLQKLYPEGIFTLRLFGGSHHFIHHPGLSWSLLNKPVTIADNEFLSIHMFQSNFGMNKKEAILYDSFREEAFAQLGHLYSEPGLTEMVTTTIDHLKRNIVDFVTFNSAPADQKRWEVLAGADIVRNAKGESFVEADLMELVRNFIAQTANPALFGTDLVENFPDAWELLWQYDEAFVAMALGVPGWVPWPRLQRAKAAKKKFISYMHEFNTAMDKHLNGEDPGVTWQDLNNVSRVVRGRTEVFRKHGLSMKARSGSDLGLAWTMNANANPLTAWMLVEIYRDPVFLEQIREEVAPYVKAVQPKNYFGSAVWIAPEIQAIDLESLLTKCPLLKGAYLETLRLYTGSWSVKWMMEDTVIQNREQHRESFMIKKGSYVHIPADLHQLDPAYFPDPDEFRAERHVRETTDDTGRTIRVAHIGGGPKMCKGREFARRELLLFCAVIISTYDIQAPNDDQIWELPKTDKRAATRHPKKPLLVWIKKRQLPDETTPQQ